MTNPYDKNKAISADEAVKIIPRAEFRVFGKNIIAGVQEHMWKCKATLYAARVMPEEIYFLSQRTNEANVKVRDGLLDIKTKVGETPEGYGKLCKTLDSSHWPFGGLIFERPGRIFQSGGID